MEKAVLTVWGFGARNDIHTPRVTATDPPLVELALAENGRSGKPLASSGRAIWGRSCMLYESAARPKLG